VNARDLAIVKMRLKQGASFKNIGVKFGVSAGRVQQIIDRFNGKLPLCLAQERMINKRCEFEPSPHAFFSDLSTGNQALFKSRGIRSLEDIAKCSSSELLRFPGIGMKSLKRISALLRMNGLKLREGDAGVQDWILSEARKADPEKGCVILENPDEKKDLDILLLERFWPVILDNLKKSGYPFGPEGRPETEFELGYRHQRSLTFMLFDEGRAFFKGQLSCSKESWMICSEFFLSLPQETELEVLRDLLGNTRFAGYPPTLMVDKRRPEDFYQIIFHSGNGASWGLKDEDCVDARIKEVIEMNVKMYEDTLDGLISPQEVSAFLTSAFNVYETY